MSEFKCSFKNESFIVDADIDLIPENKQFIIKTNYKDYKLFEIVCKILNFENLIHMGRSQKQIHATLNEVEDQLAICEFNGHLFTGVCVSTLFITDGVEKCETKIKFDYQNSIRK